MNVTAAGHSFTITSLPATMSLRLGAKILKQHGKGLTELMASGFEGIGNLLSEIDVDLLTEIRQTFGGVVTVDGKRVASDAEFDAVFSGDWAGIVEFYKLCLQNEFSHFFEAAVAAGPVAAAPDSPST